MFTYGIQLTLIMPIISKNTYVYLHKIYKCILKGKLR